MNLLGIDKPIEIIDIGASTINEKPIYKQILDLGIGHLNAFDGDIRQTESIKSSFGTHSNYFDDFLFDGSEQTVYFSKPEFGMSSLLKPKLAALNFFNGFSEYGKIEKTLIVKTKKLDDITNLPQIDFVKMDAQGAELTILKNGEKKLTNCVAIQLETSFVCLYDNQPTFGEIDIYMRQQGYVPHCFTDVKRWSISPTIFNGHVNYPGNQLLEADIIYIKNPLETQKLNEFQIKKWHFWHTTVLEV